MITHNLYCKKDAEMPITSTFSLSSDTLSPSVKYVKFWKDIEYCFIEKDEKFSDRYVKLYYTYIGREYTIDIDIVKMCFHTKEESRKIKIDKVLNK